MFLLHFSCSPALRNQLNDTTSLSNLLLSQSADPSCLDDNRDLGQAALAQDLGVAEGEQVDDGDGVGLLAGQVGLAGLSGDESPQLHGVSWRLLEYQPANGANIPCPG